MLAARNRLTSGEEFRLTVRRGQRAGGPLMVLHLATSNVDKETSSPRVGFVVSRAVGPAVVRNRVKRRLRHLLRARVDRLPAGSRLVVRAQPEAAAASHRDLAAELDRCLDRALDRATDRVTGKAGGR